MTISLKIFTHAEGRPTLYASRELDVLPISIGRDPGCTVVVEDPHKHLSRFHVEIEQQDGVHWMSVVSKVNPVMVKGRRYGPGTRLTIKSGDAFEMGEYEIHVNFPEPGAPAAAVDIDLSDPNAIFDEPTMVSASPGAAAPPAAKAAPAAPPAGGMGDALLRAAVDGLMMLLIARAEMRKEFQAEESAMVAARDNNPLKRMSDPHAAMDFLLDPVKRTDGSLDPVQALGDACEDLRSHEIALMAAMRATILGALQRVDPQALQRAYEKSAGGSSPRGRKGKLWEFFVAQQEKLAHDAQEDFNKVFGRDFMSAYQSQLRRLKGGK